MLVLVFLAAIFIVPAQLNTRQTDQYGKRLQEPLDNGQLDPQFVIKPIYDRGNAQLDEQFQNGQLNPQLIPMVSRVNRKQHELIRKSLDNVYFVDVEKQIYKREASKPLQTAKDQISTVVYLMNAVILGEAVVQNLTTFGEIATNLMIIQNMPMNTDWISSIDLSGIDMAQLGELQKVVEDGYDKDVPTEIVEQVMNIADRLSSLDSVAKASQKICQVAEKYDDAIKLNTGTSKTLQASEFLPSIVPIITRLKANQSPLLSLKIGAEFISSIKNINPDHLRGVFKYCKPPKVSNICNAYIENSFANITTNGLVVENIRISADLFRLVHYAAAFSGRLVSLIANKDKITAVKKQLMEISVVLQNPSQDINFQKTKFSEVVSALVELKGKGTELKSFSGTINLFQPISKVSVDIKKRKISRKRIRSPISSNENIFKSFNGLSEGITSLDKLSKVTVSSSLLPENYRNAKIVERIDLMKEFVLQRGQLLELSIGIGAIEYVLAIIKNVEDLAGVSLKVDSMKTEFDLTVDDFQLLKSIGNISEGVSALEKIEQRITLLNTPQWEKIMKDLTKLSFSFEESVFFDLFTPLPQIAEFAIDIKKVLQSSRNSEQELQKMGDKFFSGIAVLSNLTQALSLIQFVEIPTNEDIKIIKEMIVNANIDGLPANEAVLDLQTGFKSAVDIQKKVESVFQRKSKHAEFTSKMSELIKLKQGVPNKPDQKEIDALQPMMKELQKMKALNIRSELQHDQPSPMMKKLMNGTPYGSEELGEASKGLSVYRKMVKDIPSTDDLKNDPAAQPVADLLDGVDTLQVVPADDTFNAYSVFRDWQKMNDGLEKMEKYVISTVEKKKDPAVAAKVAQGTGLVYNFLGRLDSSDPASLASLKNSISLMIHSLRQPDKLDCSKTPNDPNCKTQSNGLVNGNNSDESSSSSNWTWILLGILCFTVVVVVVLVVYFGLKKLRKNEQKTPLSDESNSPNATNATNATNVTNVANALPSISELDSGSRDHELQNTQAEDDIRVVDNNLIVPGFPGRKLDTWWTLQVGEFNFMGPRALLVGKMRTRKQKPAVAEQIKRMVASNMRQKNLYVHHENHVKLKSGVFYSANRIRCIKNIDVIACEAPIRKTISVFSEMILQEDASVIVQLCSQNEMFFSNEAESEVVSMPYSIGHEDENYKITSVQQFNELTTRYKENANEEKSKILVHHLTFFDKKQKTSRVVLHICHNNCPDVAIPRENDSFLDILDEAKKYLKKQPGKMFVHCMAGAGRTMTFVSVVYLVELAETDVRNYVFKEVVALMRKERNGAVQSRLQYMYIQVVMANYYARNGTQKQIDFYADYSKVFKKLRFEEEYRAKFKKAHPAMFDLQNEQKEIAEMKKAEKLLEKEKEQKAMENRKDEEKTCIV